MGCWNGTCAISNLPIEYKTPVKLIFLQGEYNYHGISGFFKPDDYMAPAFYPIDALYNDYGSVINVIEDWNTKLITDYFIKRYGEQIPEEYDEDKLVDTSIENVAKIIERGNLLEPDIDILHYKAAPDPNTQPEEWKKWFNNYKVYSRKERKPLSFVLVRKDVWDNIISFMSEEEDYSHFLKKEHIVKYKFLLKEEFETKIGKSIKISDKLEAYLDLSFYSLNPFICNDEKENLILYSVYHKFYVDNINDKQLTENIFNYWYENELINFFMERTRKAWAVHPGDGSQNTYWNLYASFSKIVNEIASSQIKKWQEKNEDYDENN